MGQPQPGGHATRTLALWPVLGLVVLPLLGGLCLRLVGRWRARHGKRTTSLATFYGGAALAFGMALARLLVVELR